MVNMDKSKFLNGEPGIIPLSADLPSFCRKSSIEVIDWKEFISSDGISEVRCAPWITVKIDDVLNKGN